MRTLHDRVVAITGAASGIGRATALAFATKGCELALADVDADGLAETAREAEQLGRRVTTHLVDVADRLAVEAWAEEVVRVHGRVHVLINNAGVTVTRTFDDHSWEDWDWVLGVNLFGVLHGCRAFLPHLRAADEAHIVNISSIFGIFGVPGQSAYCTSKFAVRGLSESLWEELEGSTVGLTVVHPGGVRTNIVRNARTDDTDTQQRIARMFERMAMSPDKVADRIVRAVERGNRRLVVTPEAVFGDIMRRLFPVWSNRIAGGRARRIMRLGGD